LDKEEKNPSSRPAVSTDENAGEHFMSLALTTLLLTWAVLLIVFLCVETLVQTRRAGRNGVRESRHWR
jgi:hypothetical protein